MSDTKTRKIKLRAVSIKYEERDKYRVFIQVGENKETGLVTVLATVASNSFFANLQSGAEYDILYTAELTQIMAQLKERDDKVDSQSQAR